MVRPNAPFANMRTTLEGALAKRKEREKEAGWVNKKLTQLGVRVHRRDKVGKAEQDKF